MGRGSGQGTSRIAVCSGDQLRRDALAAYLGGLPDFNVVGRVVDGTHLVPLVELERPHIVLIDGGQRPGETVPTLQLLHGRHPSARLVLAYERLSAEEFGAAREAGVAAVVPYAHGLGGLVSVLRGLATGVDPTSNGVGLTGRQREILLLVASGHQVSEIAEMLDISPGTVENHKRRVYAKLNATSAAHAVARAATLGIIGSTPAAQPAAPAAAPRSDGGQSPLAVVVGFAGPVLDRVVTTLIGHRLAVVREHCPQATPQIHWHRSHRGPVVRVLVDPAPEQWRVGATLGWAAVMVHDGRVDRRTMGEALTNGVLALVHADHVESRLMPAIHLAAGGYMVMDPASSGLFTDSMWNWSADLPPVAPRLTAREHDILRSIGRNQTVRQTARTLGIAMKTVENAQGHLFSKLGVHNRAAALAKAYTLGLLQPTDAILDAGTRLII
jgi:DNA-binding NarL/FixJ family response regulator